MTLSNSDSAWPACARLGIALAAILIGIAQPAYALVFLPPADMDYNTTAPAGALANSGWQWTGALGGIAAVPIGPRHIIAAAHIGGSVGDSFTFNGVTYATIAQFDDPDSDLRVYQIDGTFPAGSWAPLYRASSEAGRLAVVHGRGSTRGSPVTSTQGTNGYQWAPGDGRLRWGTNTVALIATDGDGTQFLYTAFEQSGGANEVQAAGGDSSGPVFIDDGAGYKLAGVMFGVDCCFSTTGAGNGFQAAIYDVRGLYAGSAAKGWTLYRAPPPPCASGEPCSSNPIPAGFYSTRISARAAWIDSILSRQPQTIDFPAIPDRGLAQSPFTPSVGASSGLPATLSVVSGPASVNGNVVTLTGTGSVTLTAQQSGDATYLPATPVQRTFNVTAGTTQVPAMPMWGIASLLLLLPAVGVHTARRRRRFATGASSGEK